jgi:peptidoglycan/xylan/chitin deacetylase (PgdA/CDA1 family)
MIKLVTGVTPTCWRPPYGDVDVSVFIILTPTRDRHVIWTQDRIRAIANALGLQTIVWHYDSNDWRVGLNNITAADVDTDYQLFINNETAGNFNSVGAIMLTHELNNFTMSEAVKWYPALKAAFSVRQHTIS